MSKIRSKEFADFVNDGKPRAFGKLVMAGDKVWSYNVVIAQVIRECKEINLLTTKFSKTTSTHQRAVELGFQDVWNTGAGSWVLNYKTEL